MKSVIQEALMKGVEMHKAGQFDTAKQLYASVIEIEPRHADANHNTGVIEIDTGDISQAIPFLKIALEENSNNGQHWISYIDALIRFEAIDDAKGMLTQARQRGAQGGAFDQLEQRIKERDGSVANVETLIAPETNVQDPLQDMLQHVLDLYNQGQLQQALDEANKLLNQFPGVVTLYNIQGAANMALGNTDDAIESFKLAISIKPDYPDAYNNLGNALHNQGKLQEAIVAYNKALALKPDYSDVFSNMGNTLHNQGKLQEAIVAFKKALALKPDYADAYSNMGNALHEQGKPQEAIAAYSKALLFKPDNAEACNNMGNALYGQGKLQEALEAYNKALAIKPVYAEAYYNRGIALKEQGKLGKAIEAYNKALAIKPDYADAYNNMGLAFKEQGWLEKAIEAYDKALAIKPDYAEAYNNMGVALKGITFTKPNPDLQLVISSLLDHETSVRPKDIAKAAISLLKFEPGLQTLFQKQPASELEQSMTAILSAMSEVPLLIKLMSICPLADLELEEGLTDIRSGLLSSVSEMPEHSDVLRFQSALALQCFTNEYIYNQNDAETKAVQTLESKVAKSLSNGQQPNPHSVLCLASYKALLEYEWCDFLANSSDIEEVFKRQVIEPKQETSLKPDIPALEEVTDKVSEKVREQYEGNPYPRWVNLGLNLKPAPISSRIKEIELRLDELKISKVEAPDILIAGCGTGQHSIGTASRFKNSKVLAIDLSLSSLAYAKRKTEELGIQNIEYMQADILHLGKLNKQFDIVESAGVLHHMDEPMAGWRVLTDCLKPGGLMKIGLYSELARQHVVKIRKEISLSGIGSSGAEIRSFRRELINSNEDHHRSIICSHDFYSLSDLRDLLFHVQEHRFTIPQIRDCLHELGLKFCGFEADKLVREFKLANTDANDPYDLDKWNTYEELNPNIFAGMYQFWCQKV